MKNLKSLKYDSNGLIPVIIQDYKKKDVLMFAFMNSEALRKTISGKRVCFYSRTRKKLWIKGEQSGNCQKVKKMWTDCDCDCLLIEVEQKGGAACHEGYRSCFFRRISARKITTAGKRIFDPAKVYKS